MSDIPADIYEQARAVCPGIAVVDWVEAEIIIARAILAERERCAKIAEDMAESALARWIRSPEAGKP
ncbi:MAG: hypothetical protein E5Y10_24500 [Mesorhizobium sp.]|nr:MAG: hypothetical protein E5Y10_24500 [Mesorhizobium sp.]